MQHKLKINNMKHFNLDQLRADAAQHFTDYQTYSMTSTQFDEVIDLMIEALIGSDYFQSMQSARHSQIVFSEFLGGQYLCEFHNLNQNTN